MRMLALQVRDVTLSADWGLQASQICADSTSTQGSWRAVAERTKAYKASNSEQCLTSAAWHIFALAKLRMYGEASAELASLGSLDAAQYEADGLQGQV